MKDTNSNSDMSLKKISVVIPTYNEEKNIPMVANAVAKIFSTKLSQYDYRILFVDNCSTDSSRKIIREMSKDDYHIQYIFYVRNFGFSRSTFYGLTQAEGDCAVLLFADMQDPPDLIVDFVEKWDKGALSVVGIKDKSDENKFMYIIRKMYYRFMGSISTVEHIEQFTGFGLYDKKILSVFGSVKDPIPYLRGMVAELAPECKKVFYTQRKREYGKSSFNFWRLYEVGMLGVTSYSRIIMRCSVVLGFFIAMLSIAIAMITFVLKFFHLVDYPVGNAAILFGVYFIGGILLLFCGVLGEYIADINIRTMGHPIVVEEERGNL